MKTIISLVLLIASAFSGFSMTLTEAYKDPLIEVEITGESWEDESSFDDKAITFKIFNKKRNCVNVTVDEGFILDSDEEDFQDMILTEPLQILAKSGVMTKVGAYAMCIQAENKSPIAELTYTPSKYADDELRSVCRYIYKNKYQNSIGQDAVWAVSDNHSIYDIAGPPEDANPIREYVAQYTPEAFDPTLVNENEHYIESTVKMYGLFLDFYLYETSDIKLQVFNHKGEFERDLFNKENQEKGKYEVTYRVALSGLLGQKYFVRLYVGDEMRKEFTLFIKES